MLKALCTHPCILVLYLRNLCLTQSHRAFSLCLLLEALQFQALHLNIWSILGQVLYVGHGMDCSSIFSCGYLVVPVPFVEEAIFSPLSCLCTVSDSSWLCMYGFFYMYCWILFVKTVSGISPMSMVGTGLQLSLLRCVCLALGWGQC